MCQWEVWTVMVTIGWIALGLAIGFLIGVGYIYGFIIYLFWSR